MSRMTQIKHELIRGLKGNIRFGEKKRDVKIAAHAEYLKNGGSKDGYLHPKGLFSVRSFHTYSSDIATFARWAAQNTNAKDARSAKQYVHKYLKELIAKGRSAPTIKKYAHALARAYDCEVKDFGVELPKRRRADIKRSRNEVKSDPLLSCRDTSCTLCLIFKEYEENSYPVVAFACSLLCRHLRAIR